MRGLAPPSGTDAKTRVHVHSRLQQPRKVQGHTNRPTPMNKPSLHTLLQNFETEQVLRELPTFGPGDTVVVNVKVKEGNRERVQAYAGVVNGKKNAGLNSAVTVRKRYNGHPGEGEGPTASPL